MVEVTDIENDMGCDASITRYDRRNARIILSTASLGLREAGNAIDAFRAQIIKLPLKDVSVSVGKNGETLTVGADFRLPILFSNRRIARVIKGVFVAYHEHLFPLIQRKVDPTLGELTWDAKMSIWQANVILDGTEVPLNLRMWGEGEQTVALDLAKELIENWAIWRQKINGAQRDELLPLYNEIWREPERPHIDLKELQGRMSMCSIDCELNGWRCVNYDQQGLFTDHIVEMRISPEGVIKAVLAG